MQVLYILATRLYLNSLVATEHQLQARQASYIMRASPLPTAPFLWDIAPDPQHLMLPSPYTYYPPTPIHIPLAFPPSPLLPSPSVNREVEEGKVWTGGRQGGAAFQNPLPSSSREFECTVVIFGGCGQGASLVAARRSRVDLGVNDKK